MGAVEVNGYTIEPGASLTNVRLVSEMKQRIVTGLEVVKTGNGSHVRKGRE